MRTAERLVKLIAVFCILSWRVFCLTMINRSAPKATPELALTGAEIAMLDRPMPDKGQLPPNAKRLEAWPGAEEAPGWSSGSRPGWSSVAARSAKPSSSVRQMSCGRFILA